MTAPTIAAEEVAVSRPVLKGTWSEIAARSLEVSVAGKTYVLGSNPELVTDGIGNWTLSIPISPDGRHI